MADREMLELAAKAAGVEIDEYGVPFTRGVDPIDGASYCDDWDPINDDGEALRLAVRLGLCVQVLHKYGETQVFRPMGYELEKHGSDPLAATRRAIVRAAAEIGKGMK